MKNKISKFKDNLKIFCRKINILTAKKKKINVKNLMKI